MLGWYRAIRLQRPLQARVGSPLLGIWGDGDRFLDRRLAEASIAWCDRGEVVHLGHATHWVQHEEPKEVNRLLLGFLAGGPR